MSIRQYIKEQEVLGLDLNNIVEQKTGAEIAKELGVTRNAVSQMLKRAIGKVYKEVRKLDKSFDAFEAVTAMSLMFNVDEEELSKFIRLFPPDIRKEIETDAKKRMPVYKE